MKTNNFDENDAPLRSLLKEWKPEASLPPGFQDLVWCRIEHSHTAPTPSILLAMLFANWITNHLPKPALATAYLAALLIIGAGAGWSHARQEAARVADALSARYVQAIDPYLTTPQP